jgi:uncharacterized protein YdeI (YjbR/CyaY-like superfamily)
MAAVYVPELLVADVATWRAWLDANHDTSSGVWLILHKKGGSVTALTYEQALQEALCYGWIDGQISRRDDESYRQRFTPRRPKSPWSKSNVDRVAQLIADDRMMAAGYAAIEAAKSDGRWDRAYAGAATAEVPDDLAAALAAVPAALEMFGRLSSTNRYAVIYRVNDAKRADTRARRIAQYVDMLARGETIHPQQTI